MVEHGENVKRGGKVETGGCGRDRLQTCQKTFPHLVGKTSEASMTFQDVHQSAP